MFKLISQDNYPTIKTFVNRYKYKVCVNSVLAGTARGIIFADNSSNPSMVLVWMKPYAVYFFGKSNSFTDLNNAFKKLIDETIAPECQKDGITRLSVSFFDEKEWQNYFSELIETDYLDRNGRWTGIFDKQAYLNFRQEKLKELPAGYKLSVIDREIIMCEENSDLRDDITGESWNSIDDYLKSGFGFCILKDSTVVSACYSVFTSDNSHYEISVDTYDEDERKQGLATQCVTAFIDCCLERNSLPHWETDHDNFPSQKMANKMGFTDSVVENRFSLLFDRANNFLFRAYCHLNKKDIDLDFINSVVKKAFADNNQKPDQEYIYAVAGKLAKNNIQNHVIFLLDEYLKIDKMKLQMIKDNANFKLLHDTKGWNELIAKYA